MNKLFKYSGIVRDVREDHKDTVNGPKILQVIKVEILTPKPKNATNTETVPEIYYLQYWGNKYKFQVGDVGHFIGDLSYRKIRPAGVYTKDADGNEIQAEIGMYNLNIRQYISNNVDLINWFTAKFKYWKSGFGPTLKQEDKKPNDGIELEDLVGDELWQ